MGRSRDVQGMPERYHNAESVMSTEYIGPFADLLGMEFLEQGEGSNVSRLPVTDKLLSRNRVLHGGAVFSIADTSMGLAYGTVSPEGQIGVTNEIKICYFAPVPKDAQALYTFSKVLHRGRRGGTVECELKTAAGKLVGKAIGSFTLIDDPIRGAGGGQKFSLKDGMTKGS
ncbi:MAG: PaaI family thioesterase [Chrysiogenetes bacterium]|nr:PaaI family thioesterase [Chrysiogenetes bacterium]